LSQHQRCCGEKGRNPSVYPRTLLERDPLSILATTSFGVAPSALKPMVARSGQPWAILPERLRRSPPGPTPQPCAYPTFAGATSIELRCCSIEAQMSPRKQFRKKVKFVVDHLTLRAYKAIHSIPMNSPRTYSIPSQATAWLHCADMSLSIWGVGLTRKTQGKPGSANMRPSFAHRAGEYQTEEAGR